MGSPRESPRSTDRSATGPAGARASEAASFFFFLERDNMNPAIPRRTALQVLGAAGLAAALPAVARAQSADAWPSRPITYVVPFTPGGSTDVIGRLIAQKLAEALGQPVVVDNKPGAAGAVGASYVAKAKADGYTLFGGTISTHAINASL